MPAQKTYFSPVMRYEKVWPPHSPAALAWSRMGPSTIRKGDASTKGGMGAASCCADRPIRATQMKREKMPARLGLLIDFEHPFGASRRQHDMGRRAAHFNSGGRSRTQRTA